MGHTKITELEISSNRVSGVTSNKYKHFETAIRLGKMAGLREGFKESKRFPNIKTLAYQLIVSAQNNRKNKFK
jgi:hypothetical protein